MIRDMLSVGLVLVILLSGFISVMGDCGIDDEITGDQTVYIEGLMVTLKPPMGETGLIQIVMADGVTYHMINAPGAGKGEIGKPDVPVFREWVMVPLGTTPELTVFSGESVTYTDIRIPVVRAPIPDSSTNDDFSRDFEFQGSEEYYPGEFATLQTMGTIRGQPFIMVEMFPYQYHAEEEKLRVYPDFFVTVNFSGEVLPTPNRFKNSNMEKIMGRLAVNTGSVLEAQGDLQGPAELYGNNQLLPGSGGGTEGAAEYLIITDPIFKDSAETLGDWKNKMGIPTYVATTDQTGTTADDITAYIENAYTNWDPAPYYLLIFGDADYIPPHYETEHPYYSDNRKVGTDVYYAAMEGSTLEYFPDLSHGRIPAESVEEAERWVNHIINYEKNPITLVSFYENTTHAGQFQDYVGGSDGIADRRFLQTSEDIVLFLGDQDYLGKYDARRIYEYSGDAKPEYWTSESWSFGGGPAGDPGDPIPIHLSTDWDKPPGEQEFWGGDANDISAAVNSGTFLLIHRNHGGTWGWGTPYYHYTHVQDLNNGDKLPVVWSINCNTGYYDSETCNDATHTISFVEAWGRNPNGGSAGVLAATRVSYSGLNDRLAWGFTDAIWPEFLDQSTDPPVTEMGDVLNYGRYYMYNYYGNWLYTKITFEMFHWFGDPTLQIRTEVPQEMNVYHPAEISVGVEQQLTVTVEDTNGIALEDARVAIRKNSEIYMVGLTDSAGEVTFAVEPNTTGTIELTVSKHNFIPSENNITVSDVIPSMDIDLYAGGPAQGWNFVSFNLELEDYDLETILADIDGKFSDIMYYDAAIEQWKSYSPGRGEHYNNLHSWNRTMGIWIRVTVNCTLTVEGYTPVNTDIVLHPGWNMVSLPSESSGNHGLPAEVTKVGYFHGASEYNLAYDYDPWDFVFEPGKGYYLYSDATDPVIWNVEY